jgi:hypothetical protein
MLIEPKFRNLESSSNSKFRLNVPRRIARERVPSARNADRILMSTAHTACSGIHNAVYLPGVGVGMGVVSGLGAGVIAGVGAGEPLGELSGLGEGDGLAFAVLPFVRA